MNAQIRVPEVRLIDDQGGQLGIVSTEEARQIAKEAGLDLVEVSPNASPPVCRVMDIGKHLYEINKKRHAAKKKQKQMLVKEMKFRPTTEDADFQVKLRKIREFLLDGNKVKASIRFRGREMAHQELGQRVLIRLRDDVLDIGEVEQFPRVEGRQMVMVLAPKKSS